jgi:ribonuclease PH
MSSDWDNTSEEEAACLSDSTLVMLNNVRVIELLLFPKSL